MKTFIVRSATIVGTSAISVTVTANARPGPLEILGLPDLVLRETRVRVRSALQSAGVDSSGAVVAVHPTPTSSSGLDLAIAVAVAAVHDRADANTQGVLLIGELGLDGRVLPVRGTYAIGHSIQGKFGSPKALIAAPAVATELAYLPRIQGWTGTTLADVLCGRLSKVEQAGTPHGVACLESVEDVAQPHVREALKRAASDRLRLLLVGAPGSGKLHHARRLCSCLPVLDASGAADVASVHSAAGLLGLGADGAVRRPFRAPHHTVSEAGLLGGGRTGRPGEVSLAHRGVLLLDEVGEFRSSTLAALNVALRDGCVHVNAGGVHTTLPARALVVGTTLPCPCGYSEALGNAPACKCTKEQIARHFARANAFGWDIVVRVDQKGEVAA